MATSDNPFESYEDVMQTIDEMVAQGLLVAVWDPDCGDYRFYLPGQHAMLEALGPPPEDNSEAAHGD